MTAATSLDRLELAAQNAREALLAERADAGMWRGSLSSSALSTATAVAALRLAARALPERAEALLPVVQAGRDWLIKNRNADGGYGDTVDSPSNLSTTALCKMALGPRTDPACEAWLRERVGDWNAANLARELAKVYGEDRTFAVPILMACAVGGSFDEDPHAWRSIPALPFELAVLPQGLFRFLGLPVVSYALPALIAVGQVIAHHKPSANPIARLTRAAARGRTLRVLESIQPSNGGFLEATPLTSFVVLSLVAAGEAHNPVVTRGLDFLVQSVRPSGAWPIDTDLATWLTTLSISALDGSDADALNATQRDSLKGWLMGQQHTRRHPYTGADPGGWAWTELPGGVPDADDTAGAVLALHALDAESTGALAAANAGLEWLVALQNKDGGIPTFCKGWGRLPFDQSCPDLTAHFLRANEAWRAHSAVARDVARDRALRFLLRDQRDDGAWVPLWFGNQEHARKLNPVYGTSRVLRVAGLATADADLASRWQSALERGMAWLLRAQAEDGGFGGDAGLSATIEETSLALEALTDLHASGVGPTQQITVALERAVRWLCDATRDGTHFPASPIGLYFAQLWYHERLYPLIFCVSALERARKILSA